MSKIHYTGAKCEIALSCGQQVSMDVSTRSDTTTLLLVCPSAYRGETHFALHSLTRGDVAALRELLNDVMDFWGAIRK